MSRTSRNYQNTERQLSWNENFKDFSALQTADTEFMPLAATSPTGHSCPGAAPPVRGARLQLVARGQSVGTKQPRFHTGKRLSLCSSEHCGGTVVSGDCSTPLGNAACRPCVLRSGTCSLWSQRAAKTKSPVHQLAVLLLLGALRPQLPVEHPSWVQPTVHIPSLRPAPINEWGRALGHVHSEPSVPHRPWVGVQVHTPPRPSWNQPT